MITDVKEVSAAPWQRLVAELASPAPDDRVFLDRLLRVIGQVAAARQAVVFVPMSGERGELVARPLAVWPAPSVEGAGGGGAQPSAILHGEDTARAAYAAIESGASRVFNLTGDSPGYEGAPPAGHILAVALPSEQTGGGGAGAQSPAPSPAAAQQQKLAPSPGAICLLVEARSRPALQSSLAMVEVLVGYIHLHAARGQIKRALSTAAAADSAAKLLGIVNDAQNFKGACIQLVNDLARRFGADRVALSWVKNEACKVVAISDTENFNRQTAMIKRLEAAMDECLDQDHAVMYPAPSAETDAVLGRAIVYCHRELGTADQHLRVCSVPLRHNDQTVGVITFETKASTTTGIDPSVVERVQAVMDLVAPVLSVRRRDDLPWALRTLESARTGGAWLVGPRHTLWKLAALVLMTALIACTVIRTTHRVGALAELRPVEKRIIAAPLDGVIRALGPSAKAGEQVKAGDLLVEFDTAELKLQLQDALSRLSQADKARAQAMKDAKPSEAARAQAQAEAAQAQIELYRSRLERATVIAPIDGTVITGNLTDKIGASVKLGDELFQIAPLDRMIAVVRLDESDLLLDAEGKPLIAPGSKGTIATRSNPGAGFSVTVQRIVPMAQASDGKNLFEVWTSVDQPAAWMRPGMEAVARLDSGNRSLMWIGTRKVVDAVRLWWW